jgi:hypothetical protein
MKMMVDPEQQTPEIRELGITVGEMEAVTIDSLATLFKGNTARFEKKKAIAKELFRVAKMEARYNRGEMGQSMNESTFAVPTSDADHLIHRQNHADFCHGRRHGFEPLL